MPHFRREPSLRIALAFEVIFHVPAQMLFRGDYAQVETSVAQRAKRMVGGLVTQHHKPGAPVKLMALKRITETAGQTSR